MMGALGMGIRMVTAEYLLDLFHVLFGDYLPITVNGFDIMFLGVAVLVGTGAHMFFVQDLGRRMGWLAHSICLYPELRGIGGLYLAVTMMGVMQPWGLWARSICTAGLIAFCLQVLTLCVFAAVWAFPRTAASH